MCPPILYKSLPCILILLTIGETVLGMARIVIFFSPRTLNSTSVNGTIPSPYLSSEQAKAAFTMDWITSIIPTLLFCYITILFLLATCFWFIGCIKMMRRLGTITRDCHCIWSFTAANIRFMTLTCNCPCYKSRPQLRFQVRLGVMCIFITLRILAVILYASDTKLDGTGVVMAALSAISVVFILLTIAVDYYQYRMWWYYRPDQAYQICRCWCCRQAFHPCHERFLPEPLLGRNRNPNELGNKLCLFDGGGNCPKLSLDHIVIFHAFDSMPQSRYQRDNHRTYFGFHRTSPESAVGIAQQGFRISATPPQLLGFGVYFARSFKGTERKARHEGALICAEVDMRNVIIVTRDELHNVSNSNRWHHSFDTVYYYHPEEDRDEFCVKDPAQILRWIIIMNDDRLRRYGLDRAFENTRCGCI
ncbi:unnamed protein product [Rotaria magnacalcarata]|uniref:Uncharacterized protein n=2 Tax=Rotaria magnacalcarata TaxID=392030 RepID=A0A815YJS3_9BILA|nr:unnamed protein product [Rotaria magnacalcarata]